jgi:hypothetical protein
LSWIERKLVSLEFNKVVVQVQKMGATLEKLDLTISDKLQIALERLHNATDLQAIHERIELVRRSNVSGYRGAAPLDEDIYATFPPPPPPESATILAADGSQIYPDHHSPSLYYLINIGVFVYHHGPGQLPEQSTTPELFYTEKYLRDEDKRVVSNQTINARRTVAEMRTLAEKAWDLRGFPRPLIALHDGNLLKFFAGGDAVDYGDLEQAYLAAMVHLHDAQATLAGFIDDPLSTPVVSLLHLLSLTPQAVSATNFKTDGDLEGLMDKYIFSRTLEPGERSAIMVQNSPQNLRYKEGLGGGASYEIAFFYVNVSDGYPASIARVDIPMWVARDSLAVDELHALILTQCAIQGRKHYPYALTRADELAYVSGTEKAQLNELIRVEMRNRRLYLRDGGPAKMETKLLARGENKRHHKLGG